jgi:hypothetical protein
VLAVWLGGGILSLGSLIGFLTVFGIAARNGILMISHFQHLEDEEGEVFGPALVLRGAKERLAPSISSGKWQNRSVRDRPLVPLVARWTMPQVCPKQAHRCPVSANLIWLLAADQGRQMTSAPRRLILQYGPWWPFSRWCLIKSGLRRIGG